jgi:Xaa-Pro aminopeptidase
MAKRLGTTRESDYDVERQREKRASEKLVILPRCEDPPRRRDLELDDESWLLHYFGIGCELEDPFWYTFTPDQRAVYQVVRDAQAAAERQARGGRRAGLMSDSSNAVLAAGLAKLGLIEAPDATYDCSADGKNQCKQYRLFYMHGLGHGIGIEVHDPDRYEVDGTLQPGSVFTIEPGIYVRENVLDVLPKTERNRVLSAKLARAVERYRNIGVRIEDDILVTRKAGGVNLTAAIPKTVAEIERAMR